MQTFTLRYPGDQPKSAVLMNRQEFLAAHPRTPIMTIDLATGKMLTSEPLREDEIRCDGCSADPLGAILVIGGTRAYCHRCAARVAKYLETTEG